MNKNTIRNTTIAGIAAGLLVPTVNTVAQSYQDNINELRKDKILESYRTIDSIASTSFGRDFNSFEFEKEIRNLEHFLGAENGIYNLTSASVKTLPNSGDGSIVYIGNEAWLRVVQVGSGYGKLNTGEFRAEARVSRDLSTTFATISNHLGLSDSEINEMILLSNGISSQEQQIVRDKRTNNVIDILYTGKQTRPDIARCHISMNGEFKTPYHINALPGDDLYFPLTPVMNKLGYNKTLFMGFANNQPTNNNNNNGQNSEIEITIEEQTQRQAKKCLTCPKPPRADPDSIEYRMGLMGTGSNTHVPGVVLYTQLGKCQFLNRLDAEIGFSFMRIADEFNNLTKESMKSDNPSYEGFSQLLEKGAFDIKNYRMHFVLSRHIGKTQYFFLRGGISADYTTEKYNGSEERTTWFENTKAVNPSAAKIDYDTHTNGAISNKNNIRFSPVLGAGVDLGGRLRLTADWHMPVQKAFNSKYAGSVNAGTLEFGVGLNFGGSKHDHRYSNDAINKQNQTYDDTKSYKATIVRK